MPHLLIAGSTGSGKSVMLNTMIMSLLYKSTPDEVRMIMVDPKRVELGHLRRHPAPAHARDHRSPKKATNALRNAVLEMERRLKLLAVAGCPQHRSVQQEGPASCSEFRAACSRMTRPKPKSCEPLPYILILIDELADLMMLERANVEEAVTRLAQMARAVGMHLVLATQRPSVDVITGLIKANFPTRISFRVATRVDSRTILDVMGSEHLLGKGDMLFLPPGLVPADARPRRIRLGDGNQLRGRLLERAGPARIRQDLPARSSLRRRRRGRRRRGIRRRTKIPCIRMQSA